MTSPAAATSSAATVAAEVATTDTGLSLSVLDMAREQFLPDFYFSAGLAGLETPKVPMALIDVVVEELPPTFRFVTVERELFAQMAKLKPNLESAVKMLADQSGGHQVECDSLVSAEPLVLIEKAEEP